jgi:hypothetical protein
LWPMLVTPWADMLWYPIRLKTTWIPNKRFIIIFILEHESLLNAPLAF